MSRGPLTLRWEEDTLYARDPIDVCAVGYAVDGYACVYERIGDDEVRHVRRDVADPRAALLEMLAQYYPDSPIVEAP